MKMELQRTRKTLVDGTSYTYGFGTNTEGELVSVKHHFDSESYLLKSKFQVLNKVTGMVDVYQYFGRF